MDDILLLDAIERYMKDQMTAQERTFFEEMRKNNPAIDQLTVEHLFFLKQLEETAGRKNYIHTLNEVENKLTNEGVIAKKNLKGKSCFNFKKLDDEQEKALGLLLKDGFDLYNKKFDL